MSRSPSRAQTWLRRNILTLLFLVAFIASCPLSVRRHETETIRDVATLDKERMRYFPILVLTAEKAEILYLGDMPRLAQLGKDYHFLVPPGKELFYQERLQASFTGARDAIPKFEVEQISPERQRIMLGIYGDGKTVSWYEATDKEIFPQKEQSQEPLDAAVPLFYSLVASIGIVIAAAIFLKVRNL